MTLSELKEVVDSAIEFFSEDYDVEIYGNDGVEFDPIQIVKVKGSDKVIFD